MKKIINVVLTILMAVSITSLLSTTQINADIGSVNWDPYYAWCIEKEGITITREGYGEESTYIPYGARLYIWHGSNMDRAYSVDDTYFAQYGDYSFSFQTSIKGEHIRPVRRNPYPEFLSYETFELMAINEVRVYDGPSSDFAKVATLSAGTTVVSDYNDGMWAHVLYEGSNGWLYFNQTSKNDSLPEVIVVNSGDWSVENIKEVSLLNALDEHRGTISSIPENSSIQLIGNCSSSFSKNYYVSFEDNNGWLIDGGNELVFDVSGSKLHSYDDIVLYEDLSSNEVVGIVQPDEEVELLKVAFDTDGKERYCCRSDGMLGWTGPDPQCFVDANVLRGYEKGFAKEDTEIYKAINGDKEGFRFAENEQFLVVSSVVDGGTEWHYVKNAEKEGWIKGEVHYYETDVDQEETYQTEHNTRSIPSVIYYYVAGALIISISSFVLIRYLNVKKK